MSLLNPALPANWDEIEMRQAQRDQLRTEAVEAVLTKAHDLATHPDFDHSSAANLGALLTCLHQLIELDLSKLPATKDQP